MTSPNQLREYYNNMPVVMIPTLIYSDDTSGSKSKKWNPFNVWALMLAGLPKQENSKLSNIHFIAASDKVSPLAMAQPMVEDLLKLEKGIVMFDSLTQQDVVVVAPVLCILADNARSAELTNHLGSAANKFCRICQV